MRALIIKVVLSSEGPYGYSFYCICKNTLPKGKRKNMGCLCSGLRNCHGLHMSAKSRVQWFFYSLEDSSPHSARYAMKQSNILDTHPQYLYVKQRNKLNNCVIDWRWKNCTYAISLWCQNRKRPLNLALTWLFFCHQMNVNDFSSKEMGINVKIFIVMLKQLKLAVDKRHPIISLQSSRDLPL